jgi:hypothetical protein
MKTDHQILSFVSRVFRDRQRRGAGSRDRVSGDEEEGRGSNAMARNAARDQAPRGRGIGWILAGSDSWLLPALCAVSALGLLVLALVLTGHL